MPIFSIVIPTLREERFLERTLRNFDGLQIPHEIIISDGGSTDGTLDIARRYTDNIIVWNQPRRQTFGEAKNAGAALARGTFIVFIDADVIIPEPEKFFTKILAEFNRKHNLVALTTPLKPLAENRSFVDALLCAPLNWYYVLLNNVLHTGNASGEFQMVRADAFRRAGGFNERLTAGEDNDVFRRLAKHGQTLSYWKLYVRHSLRRAHTLGWLRTYGVWIKNGFSVRMRGKAAYQEWPVVR